MNRLCIAYPTDYSRNLTGGDGPPLEWVVFGQIYNCSVDTSHMVAPKTNSGLELGPGSEGVNFGIFGHKLSSQGKGERDGTRCLVAGTIPTKTPS